MKLISRNSAVRFMVLVILISSFSLVGIFTATAQKQITVGFAALGLWTDIGQNISNGLADSIKNAGGKVITADAGNDFKTHNDNIDSFVQQKVGAIVVLWGNVEQLNVPLEKARKAGIVVVGADVNALSPFIQTDVCSDAYLVGVQVARELLVDIGYKGRVLAFWPPGFFMDEARKRMLEAVAQDYPQVTIEGVPIVIDSLIPKAMAQMEAKLRQYPKGEIAAVWCSSDVVNVGPTQAIDRAKRLEIKSYSIDGNKMSFRNIIKKDSAWTATVYPSTYLIGKTAGETVLKLLQGQTTPKQIFVPVQIINKENVERLGKEIYGEKFWSEKQ